MHTRPDTPLHAPGDRDLALECLRKEGGTIACRVSGDGVGSDILVKQEGDGPIELVGQEFAGRLAAAVGPRSDDARK